MVGEGYFDMGGPWVTVEDPGGRQSSQREGSTVGAGIWESSTWEQRH